MTVALAILSLLGIFTAIGVGFCVVFQVRLARIDPAAKGASPLFRLLISPGLCALWPLMLSKLAVRRAGIAHDHGVDEP